VQEAVAGLVEKEVLVRVERPGYSPVYQFPLLPDRFRIDLTDEWVGDRGRPISGWVPVQNLDDIEKEKKKRTYSSDEEDVASSSSGALVLPESMDAELTSRNVPGYFRKRLSAYLTPTQGPMAKLEASQRTRVIVDALGAVLAETNDGETPNTRFLDAAVDKRARENLRNRSRTESSGTVLLR
jgi:hypothetical protein